jgi:uncharacterized protein (TIGR03067 family)
MICACPIVVLLPLMICGQLTQSSESAYQERLGQILPTERNGLPVGLLLGSPELLARSNLVGTWRASYLEHGGESRPDVAAGLELKINRGRIDLMQRGRPTIVVSYSVIPARIPSGFLWSLPNSNGAAFQDGIYYLEGDTLVICLAGTNAPAATQFVTQHGDQRTLYVLQRVPPITN